jgi:phytoene desaturase
MTEKIVIIGAGFGGLSAAAYLAKAGYKVTVVEKNSMPGGRAQVLSDKGYVFDMGPSWYMMPDVFDEFFADFDKSHEQYYKLIKLDPAYKVITSNKSFDVNTYPEAKKLFSSSDEQARFDYFYKVSKKNYEIVRDDLLLKPMIKYSEVLDPKVLKFLSSYDMYRSYTKRIESITSDPDLQHTLEFMSVFMGGSPDQIPAIYSLLSYVDMGLGVSYPKGGFGAVAKAFEQLCTELGVEFVYNQEVKSIEVDSGTAKSIITDKQKFPADIVIANADYHYVESKLIESKYRGYSEKYWQKADLSPSALLLFLGVNKKLDNLLHHNLFFDTDWEKHFVNMKKGNWSDDPLFYLSAPSLNDDAVSPKGRENLFVLAPQPAGAELSKESIDLIIDKIIARISKHVGLDITEHIEVKQIRAQEFFKEKYNAFNGNAFGLSHTLRQSAVFRPKMRSKKIANLYYVGQYTNPGTGVPMVVMSGKVVASLVKLRVKQ